MRLAPIIAVHLRLFYNTENELWDTVNHEMGNHWTSIQGKTLGIRAESFHVTCEASLHLYTLAAVQARHLFNERQFEVSGTHAL